MIVQSRAYVALSVGALKMTCEAPMTLLVASAMIFLAIFFFKLSVVLISTRPSVMCETSVQVILSLWCIGSVQVILSLWCIGSVQVILSLWCIGSVQVILSLWCIG